MSPTGKSNCRRSIATTRSIATARANVAALAVAASTLVMASCTPSIGTVGARFGRDSDGHLTVREVPGGLGAARAGLEPGDEVILIEGRDVRTLSDAKLHELLTGERGTKVRLTVLRGDRVIHALVERTPPRKGEVTREE